MKELELVKVGSNFYPRWAVVEAEFLLKRTDHTDLERMLESVLVVTERLKNAVPADPSETIQIVAGYVPIVHENFGQNNLNKKGG